MAWLSTYRPELTIGTSVTKPGAYRKLITCVAVISLQLRPREGGLVYSEVAAVQWEGG